MHTSEPPRGLTTADRHRRRPRTRSRPRRDRRWRGPPRFATPIRAASARRTTRTTRSLTSDQWGLVWDCLAADRVHERRPEAAHPHLPSALGQRRRAVRSRWRIRVTHLTGGSAHTVAGDCTPRSASRSPSRWGPRPEDGTFRFGHRAITVPGHQLAVRRHRFDGAPRQRHPRAGDPRLVGLAPGAVHVER